MRSLFVLLLATSTAFTQTTQKPVEQTPPGPKQEKPATKPPTAKPSAGEQPKPGVKQNKQAQPATTAKPQTPLKEFPYTPGLDPTAMDKTADPCVDLYQYSCGGWMKKNPIPPDQARWSVYGKLANDNQRYLWGVLEDAAKPSATRTATQKLIGDYFAACMDEATINNLGIQPLQTDLDAINNLKSVDEIAGWLGKQHLAFQGSGMMFGFGSEQDAKNSKETIAAAYQGGLSLPDRDYYLTDDARSKELRDKYVAHVTKMMQLAGDSPEKAAAEAKTIMEIETALAKASLTRVERRDPYKNYHRMAFAELTKTTPRFNWNDYLAGEGIASEKELNVQHVPFFAELNNQLATRSLDDWKTYLRWHLIHAKAPFLSQAFVDENFNFYSKTLRGVQQNQPRWKRCVRYVDGDLGEAVGQVYVAKVFSPALKAKTVRMTKQIESAMEQDIKSLTWMSDATKQEALKKLHTIVNKIGYPDKWRDYSSVKIDRADFLGNVDRATVFESKRQLNKIGKPLDRGEWGMTPPTVNAYYNPQMNDINFPAGVLQPPLYDPKIDDAPGYGNTGGTIGHELTHGFDDEGRKFDADGNLRDWWTEADGKEFERRANCISDQYATYTVVDDIKINSALTLGEDTADLGGLILGWMAWKAETAGKNLQAKDGLTPEQRFFVGYSQWACENDRPENLRVSAKTDPHSPGKYRVNGLVVNMPQFQEAFKCKPGQALYKAKDEMCKVW
jgi:endothelin-converting enzyme/putative endopeptidase